MSQTVPPPSERLEWFRDARFGLFVHFGVYSVLGRGEQILTRDVIPLADYEPIAAELRPGPDWACQVAAAAKAAGARYVVLTTRHCDGYCLFATATHRYHAAATGPGRDLVAEFAEAVRAEGLRVGFYYSLMNWRWPGFWDAAGHPDQLPLIVEEVHQQVRELMTGYGPVDVLWYDGMAPPGQRTPGIWHGSTELDPAEYWRSAELNAMVRQLQPHILINNRSGEPADFGTPEQKIAAEGPDRAWETCMTINPAPGWGYQSHCSVNKTPAEVLYNLLDAVRLGGNFLFNVGPDGQGHVDRREAEALDALGRWFDLHGEAVYGTRPTGVYNLNASYVQGAMYHYGPMTCRERTGYLALFRYPGTELVFSKIAPQPRSAVLLTTGQELGLTPLSNQRTLVTGLPATPPDPLAPVIRFEFDQPPRSVETRGAGWLTGDFSG